jgi:hypothetical protein
VTVENTSPSPGISVRSDGSNITFSMVLKMEESLMPAYLPSSAYKSDCEVEYDRKGSGASKNICVFEAWSTTLPKSQVLGKWFTVQFDTKIASAANGSIEFAFGRKDLSSGAASFKTQKFLGGKKTILDSIPTKANACPGSPRLGVYAGGFNPLYYADFANNATTSSYDFAAMVKFRQDKPRTWVSGAFQATFLKDGQDPLDAPRMIIDYDNFKIIQQEKPKAASQGWLTNLANVFSAWFGGGYPTEEI